MCKKIGYPFLNQEQIICKYPFDLLDMQNKNNNIYLLLLLGYLRIHSNSLGEINTSLDVIVNDLGYSVKGRSVRHHDAFRTALLYLIQNNYLFIRDKTDLNTVRVKSLIRLVLNKDNDIFSADSNFVIINAKEFYKIINYGNNQGVLLNLYLLMKKYAFRSNDGLIYVSKITLTNLLGFQSVKTTGNALKILIDLGLIYKNKPYYIKNKSGEGFVQLKSVYSFDLNNFKYTKHSLQEIYKTNDIYTLDEIDTSKIIRSKK